MSVKFYLILLVAIAGPFLVLYGIIRWRAGKIAEKFKLEHGGQLLLLTGCGVITDLNRVPGVLGLLHDRIIYETTIISERGEIAFHEVDKITLEDTKTSRHRRARKYRNSTLLEIKASRRKTPLFAIGNDKAAIWESTLRDLIQEKLLVVE
jgi:hypothetical protein